MSFLVAEGPPAYFSPAERVIFGLIEPSFVPTDPPRLPIEYFHGEKYQQIIKWAARYNSIAAEATKILLSNGIKAASDLMRIVRPCEQPVMRPGEAAVILPRELMEKMREQRWCTVTSSLALLQLPLSPLEDHTGKIITPWGIGKQLLADFMHYMGIPPDSNTGVFTHRTPDDYEIQLVKRIGEDPDTFMRDGMTLFMEENNEGKPHLSKNLRDILRYITDSTNTKRVLISYAERRPIYDPSNNPPLSNKHLTAVNEFIGELERIFGVRGYRPEALRHALSGRSPHVDYRDLERKVETIMARRYESVAHQQAKMAKLRHEHPHIPKLDSAFPIFPVVMEWLGHPMTYGAFTLPRSNGAAVNITYADSRDPNVVGRFHRMPAPPSEICYVPEQYIGLVQSVVTGCEVRNLDEVQARPRECRASYYDDFRGWAEENKVLFTAPTSIFAGTVLTMSTPSEIYCENCTPSPCIPRYLNAILADPNVARRVAGFFGNFPRGFTSSTFASEPISLGSPYDMRS